MTKNCFEDFEKLSNTLKLPYKVEFSNNLLNCDNTLLRL